MKDLKVVESGLVPIYEDRQARKVINARELHEFLGSGRQFANWIQERIDKYGFTQGEDYTSFNEIVKRENGGGTIRTEYLLTLDTAKEIAMVENNEKGRQVRRYFIECEKRLQAAPNVLLQRDAEKFQLQRERLEVMKQNTRNRQAQILKSVADDYREILSPVAIQSITSHVTILIAGKALVELPVVEKTYTATELGSLFGVSANKIGRIANEYGLKTSEYGIEVLDKAKGHNKQVPTFRYNENGKEKLRVLLTGPEGQA